MAHKEYYPPVEYIYRNDDLVFKPQFPNSESNKRRLASAEALAVAIKIYATNAENDFGRLTPINASPWRKWRRRNEKKKRGSNQSKKSVIMYERDVKLVMHKQDWGYRKRPKYGKKARRVFKQGTT